MAISSRRACAELARGPYLVRVERSLDLVVSPRHETESRRKIDADLFVLWPATSSLHELKGHADAIAVARTSESEPPLHEAIVAFATQSVRRVASRSESVGTAGSSRKARRGLGPSRCAQLPEVGEGATRTSNSSPSASMAAFAAAKNGTASPFGASAHSRQICTPFPRYCG